MKEALFRALFAHTRVLPYRDCSLMKLKNSWYSAFFLSGLTLIAISISFVSGQLNDYKLKAKESEMENVLNSYHVVQKMHFQNFNKFSESVNELGFNYTSPQVKLYSTQAQLPNDIKKYLYESELPKNSGDHYQIVGLFDHGDKFSIWIQNDVDGKKRLKVIEK